MTSSFRPTHEARLQALENIVAELISKKDIESVLHLIVETAMNLTGCDAGSIYLARSPKELAFLVAINRSVDFDFNKHIVPVAKRGFASYCFRTGQTLRIDDVYKLPENCPYSFNDDFDKRNGYRTKSVLVHPLSSKRGGRLGVLQLINPVKVVDGIKEPLPFDDDDEHFVTSFAAVATAAIENARLYESIQNLFEGFVRASVKAIESRDPPTAGHSDRVAILTVELAKRVSEDRTTSLKDTRFTSREIEEIRYASLLHDFGKIGVKEETLLKENKLFPHVKLDIHRRIEKFEREREIQLLRELIDTLQWENRGPTELEIARTRKTIAGLKTEYANIWKSICEIDKPSILDQQKSERLDEIACLTHCDLDGKEHALLHPEEITALAIPRGSLSPDERIAIEQHVTQTYLFLKEIPWGRGLEKVPEIAFAHHEKLDGTGYPRAITGEHIPIQSQLMTICDIFDALVASDRPYKASLSTEKAIGILDSMVEQKKLNKDSLEIFVKTKVFKTPAFVELVPGKKLKVG